MVTLRIVGFHLQLNKDKKKSRDDVIIRRIKDIALRKLGECQIGKGQLSRHSDVFGNFQKFGSGFERRDETMTKPTRQGHFLCSQQVSGRKLEIVSQFQPHVIIIQGL